MKFSNIEFLFFIWAIPLLLLFIVYGIRKRRRILTAFAFPKGLAQISHEPAKDRRVWKFGLILLCLLLLSAALTGPQYGYEWRDVEKKGIDIIVALDCSRSMLAADISPNRLERAKRKIYDLLDMLQGDRVGLVAFAGTAFLQCPLTMDYSAFHLFLQVLTPDYLPVGGTNLAQAIRISMESFDPAANTEKAIILITDGEQSMPGDPLEAAQEAAQAGIKIFCIGMGSETGTPVPDSQGGFQKDQRGNIAMTRLDEDTLKQIAAITGGIYVRSVAGNMDLEAIYNQEIMANMEATVFTEGKQQVWANRFQWVLALAVLALIAEMLLSPLKARQLLASALIAGCLLFHAPVSANPLQAGIEAYQQGDYELALKKFIDAQLEAPDKPEIIYNIGNALYKTGDFAAAARHYQEALNHGDLTLRQQSAFNLGNAKFRQGQFEESIKAYQKALELAPDDILAQENLAFVQRIMEQQPEEPPSQCNNDSSGGQEQPDDESAEQSSAQPGTDEAGSQDSESQEEPQGDNETAQGSESDMNDVDSADQLDAEQASLHEDNAAGSPDEPQRQAASMLNRIQDKPGRAMIPRYQQRRVDKDW